jgi:TonB family protein
VYWFHPLVWYVVHRLRSEQEHAADDYVLSTGMDPSVYANTLLALAKLGGPEQVLAGAGLTSTLTPRVKAILDSERERKMLTRRVVALVLAAAVAIALPLSAMQVERKVYKIGNGVTAPKLVHKQEPEYTQEARDAKIEGSVVLSIVIEADGVIVDAQVERGLEDGLDRNAVTAVRQWVFRPAEKDGAPVAVSARVEINFRLL